MAFFLDKINAAPLVGTDFPFAFTAWVANLVDSLNEIINDIQGALIATEIVIPSVQNVVIQSLYIPVNTVQTTFTLPDIVPIGAKVGIAGQGVGGWKLLTGAGQTIQVASVGATATTSITSASRYDSIEIICTNANTTWTTLSSETIGFTIV